MKSEADILPQNRDFTELLALLSEGGYRDLDLIERSRRIVSIWRGYGLDENQSDYLKFLSIDSQTDHLPKGSVRDHWNAQALEKADAESAECEECFKDVFEGARQGMVVYLGTKIRKN